MNNTHVVVLGFTFFVHQNVAGPPRERTFDQVFGAFAIHYRMLVFDQFNIDTALITKRSVCARRRRHRNMVWRPAASKRS